MADIDRRFVLSCVFIHCRNIDPIYRIAAAPPFPGLRRFPQGRNFKQWTGDDSKALMKVSFRLVLSEVLFYGIHTGFRYTSRQYKVMSHLKWSTHSVLF